MGRPRAINADGTKTCSRCFEDKALSEYNFRHKAKGLIRSCCRECSQVENMVYRTTDKSKAQQANYNARPEIVAARRAREEKYRLAYPERRAAYARRSYLRKNFGLTEEQYNIMLAEQNGLCAICETDKPSAHRDNMFVDHCHTTNKVRGLLCAKCNSGIGQFDDDVEKLERAIEYLKKHQ